MELGEHRICHIDVIGPLVWRLRLTPCDGVAKAFRPGQFVNLAGDSLSGGRRRAYSLLRPADAGADLHLWIERHEGGQVSPWLLERPVGTTLSLPAAVGGFGPRLDPGPRAELVGEHTGIVPLLGIAAALSAGGQKCRLHLLTSDPRFDVEAGFVGEVGKFGCEWRHERASHSSFAASFGLAFLDSEADLYLAGSGALLAALWDEARHRGLPPGRVRQEKFW